MSTRGWVNGRAGMGYTAADLEADVVSLFPNGNVREGVRWNAGIRPTCIYLSSAGTLVTLQLSPWQRELWEELELLDAVDVDPMSRGRGHCDCRAAFDRRGRRSRTALVDIRADSGRPAIDRRPSAATVVVGGMEQMGKGAS